MTPAPAVTHPAELFSALRGALVAAELAASSYRSGRGQPTIQLRGGRIERVPLADDQRAALVAELDTAIADLRYIRTELARRRSCVCDVCGQTFDGRPQARTCSDNCRQTAHRRRHAEYWLPAS